VAKSVLGVRKQADKPWITEETWKKIDERKEIRNKIISETRVEELSRSKQEYKDKDIQVKRNARSDRRRQCEELIEKAEKAACNNDIRFLYDIQKKLSGKTNKYNNPIKDKNGKLITNAQEQIKRWMEFFKDTFSCDPLNEDIHTENNIKELKIDTKPISKQEIRKAITSMKTGKASGPDNITAELLQADMETTVNILHKLLYEIWNTEQVPEEWKTGLVDKIPKKRDLSRCENWRGITLCAASKILTRVMLERMKNAVD
jgi:hypothetical protein